MKATPSPRRKKRRPPTPLPAQVAFSRNSPRFSAKVVGNHVESLWGLVAYSAVVYLPMPARATKKMRDRVERAWRRLMDCGYQHVVVETFG